jgi:hypothetical protein
MAILNRPFKDSNARVGRTEFIKTKKQFSISFEFKNGDFYLKIPGYKRRAKVRKEDAMNLAKYIIESLKEQ